MKTMSITSFLCFVLLSIHGASACGEVDRGRPGLGYTFPAGNSGFPTGAVPLYEQVGSSEFSRSDRSLPYGTEVQVVRRISRSDGTAGFAAVRVMATGSEALLPSSAIAPFRFWECGLDDLYRTMVGTGLSDAASLPMVLQRSDAVGTETNGGRAIKVADVTVGGEILCHRKFEPRGRPGAELVSCFGNRVGFDVASSAMRVMTPDELRARMPATALTHGECSYHRADALHPQSAVGEKGYLLTELAWTSAGSRRLFEMVPVYKRTGPILFEKTGLLPYGSEVTVEDFIPTYMRQGMYKIKDSIEGQEFFAQPKDIQLYPFWRCDMRAMLEDRYIHDIPRMVEQLPVEVVDHSAVAIDSHGAYIEPARLARSGYAWCDLYDPRPDPWGQGQRNTRCQADGLSFTIDASALRIVGPSAASRDP